ncbi:MAG: hypothetical protein R2865_05755 [Deinococcales bacterium]
MANANGWYDSDVTVSYACSDDTAGVDGGSSHPEDKTLSTSGSVSSTCADLAGNQTTVLSTFAIDQLKPLITAYISLNKCRRLA